MLGPVATHGRPPFDCGERANLQRRRRGSPASLAITIVRRSPRRGCAGGDDVNDLYDFASTGLAGAAGRNQMFWNRTGLPVILQVEWAGLVPAGSFEPAVTCGIFARLWIRTPFCLTVTVASEPSTFLPSSYFGSAKSDLIGLPGERRIAHVLVGGLDPIDRPAAVVHLVQPNESRIWIS